MFFSSIPSSAEGIQPMAPRDARWTRWSDQGEDNYLVCCPLWLQLGLGPFSELYLLVVAEDPTPFEVSQSINYLAF